MLEALWQHSRDCVAMNAAPRSRPKCGVGRGPQAIRFARGYRHATEGDVGASKSHLRGFCLYWQILPSIGVSIVAVARRFGVKMWGSG